MTNESGVGGDERGAPEGSALPAVSFGLSLLLCVGPVSGLAAMAVGLRSLRGKARSGVAVAGVLLGALNALASTGAFVAALAAAEAAPAPTASGLPPIAPSALPPKRPQPQSDQSEHGKRTSIESVTETRVGAVTLVDIPATERQLSHELEAQQAKASKSKEKMLVLVTAERCRPCFSLGAVLGEPAMQAALGGVRLVRLDRHELAPDLDELGFDTSQLPALFIVGPRGRPIDGITGAEWDDDTAENAGPVLGAFVKRTYKKRRQPYRAPPPTLGPPRPVPTLL